MKYKNTNYDVLEKAFKEAPSNYDLVDLVGQAYSSNPNGMFVEFGTWEGKSITEMANAYPNINFYSFDSFYGFPDNWVPNNYTVHRAGTFSTGGNMPTVPANVTLVKGFFNETLPNFNLSPISFAHIDSDIYSSAATIFKYCESYFMDNTILAFDEFYDGRPPEYEKWREGEARAFIEMLERTGYDWEPLGKCDLNKHPHGHQRFAIKIRK
jgi:hypothetical protein